jgi:esterase/lipase superfamily enzyme
MLFIGHEGATMKVTERWFSGRLQQPFTVARWGHYGTPVLLFPTAGGDAEEVERQHLIGACWPLVEGGRVKIYSCDSAAGQALATAAGSPEHRMWLFNQFHQAVRHEVVPAIHADLGGHPQPIVTAGASIGAFNAVAVLCRFPDVFSSAVGMSGTYRLQRFMDGRSSDDLFFSSPLDFVPGLDGPLLDELRQRFVVLASGEGAWENIGESWAVADVLGRKGIPNRLDSWGPEWPHEWHTWRAMLPQYLDELC